MIDVIKSSKLYFFLDVVIWFIAHNLPIVIGLLIQTYFDGNNTIYRLLRMWFGVDSNSLYFDWCQSGYNGST